MGTVTTHVLDLAHGRPLVGVPVSFEREVAPGRWETRARGVTDADGRVSSWPGELPELMAATYRLTFDLTRHDHRFFPYIEVRFRVDDPAEHFHVPLLLSPFGYSVYRGS